MAKNEYTNEIFKQRIKELIEPKLSECKSFNALSKVIDIPATSLNEYYNGVRVATAENLVKFSKFFGVSTDYLLGLETDSDIESVCNYLGTSYNIAAAMKENFDVIYGNVEEHKELNNVDESILITILECLFTHDDTFIDRLTRIIKTMVESNDVKWLRDIFEEKGMTKLLFNDSYDEDFAEFRTYKMLKDEFHEIADNCGSTISKEDKEIINNASDIFYVIKNVSFQTLISFDMYISNALYRALLEDKNKILVDKLCDYFEIGGTHEVKCYQLQKLPPHLVQDALKHFDKE